MGDKVNAGKSGFLWWKPFKVIRIPEFTALKGTVGTSSKLLHVLWGPVVSSVGLV